MPETQPVDLADLRTIREEVDEAVRAWRADATHILLLLLAMAGLPVIVMVALGKPIRFPRAELWFAACAYGGMLAGLCVPRRHYRWRAVVLLSALYLVSADQLVMRGLVGHGRVGLLVLPLLTLILLGVREGWCAVAITGAMLAGVTLMVWTGAPIGAEEMRGITVLPGFWMLQVTMLMVALIPLMILLTRFLSLQVQTMVAERQARRELEKENARRKQLESEILRVSEEERRRLGSELHDGLCQHLTAAMLLCTAAENQLAARALPEAGRISRLRSMMEQSIGIAYDVSKGLYPLDMDPEALVSALERLARKTRESTGLRCEFQNDGEVAIYDPQKALHLFRIAQEAVSNAVRHAQGQVIELGLVETDEHLTLSIRDDGAGWRTAGSEGMGGMGVRLMEHRAEAIGGILTIEHPSGGGTLVMCRVPAESPEEDLP